MFSIVKNENRDRDQSSDLEIVNDGVPLSPEWMSYEARMEWMRSAPELFKRGQLIGGNVALFENYCVAIGYVRKFEAMLASDGEFIGSKPHPAFKLMFDAMSQARATAAELKFNKEPEKKDIEDENLDSKKWEKGLLA